MGKNLDVREGRTEGAAAAGERRDLPAENKMGVMPVNRLLISMSLPMMVSMLVQALYNVVDSMFVAQLSENALTAVSLAFPVAEPDDRRGQPARASASTPCSPKVWGRRTSSSPTRPPTTAFSWRL